MLLRKFISMLVFLKLTLIEKNRRAASKLPLAAHNSGFTVFDFGGAKNFFSWAQDTFATP